MTASMPRIRPGDATVARQRLAPFSPSMIGALATQCLRDEIMTWPKPGLVSHVDNGSHSDMDAALLLGSAAVLEPFFVELAEAGAAGAAMDDLRAIGLAAERTMLSETRGVNTHRGAIFGLGLLCAAAGLRGTRDEAAASTLGAIVRRNWGARIHSGPVPLHSHGTRAMRQFGATGARGEAAAGFPSVYQIGLPALARGLGRRGGNAEAARVEIIFALIAAVDDTNVLHRGGADGLAFAQAEAAHFLAEGGVGAPGWRDRATVVHAAFVARRLSPGGAADLLAMTLFVAAVGQTP